MRGEKDLDRQATDLVELVSTLNFVARRPYSFDLSHRAIRVLSFVARTPEPLRVDDVAKLLDCAPSTASELVKRLQTKGFVERRRSTSDERVVEIGLTDAGRDALLEHTAADPAKMRAGLENMSAEDRAALLALLQDLVGKLSAPD